MTRLKLNYILQTILVAFHRSTAAIAVQSETHFLQRPHPVKTPSEMLASIAEDCKTLGIESNDVYGDFHIDNREDSYLRSFEAEVAQDFGMEDAVFMPSGVMAQSIALLIHSKGRKRFACHHSSHLLLHEEDGYKDLLHMDALTVSTKEKLMPYGYGVAPLMLEDVANALEVLKSDERLKKAGDVLSTLILELPHRELGGKLTPWDEVEQISQLCIEEGIHFHCDGARIFEASAGYGLALSELAKPFDSVYISFYKGLGGISGAMLLGSSTFCAEARKWLRRFGGNLYTLAPYAASGWSGYKRHVKGKGRVATFEEKQEKLVRIVKHLSNMEDVSSILSFDPPTPETNMFHGLLRASAKECLEASNKVEEQSGICVLSRVRDIDETDPAFDCGFRSKFELAMGDTNFLIEDEAYYIGWNDLAKELKGTKAS